MNRHTPGPWHGHEDGTVTTKDAQACVIASVNCEHVDPRQAACDTALIASAPTLLEALLIIGAQSVASDWTHEQAFHFMRAMAREASARARP